MLPDTKSLQKETLLILLVENIISLFGEKNNTGSLSHTILKKTLCRLTMYACTPTLTEKYVGGHFCDAGVEVRIS